MCMKNVNASIMFCSNIESDERNINSAIGIYDSIVPIREDNTYYLSNFNLILNCCIIFDENFKDKQDCFQLNTHYELMLWLTHVESGCGISIYKSDLCVENDDLRTWCKDFYEFKRFLKFPKIVIPKGLGNYAIKVLIRKKEEEDKPWNNQVIHSLIIGEGI